jgi:hypothetical protein
MENEMNFKEAVEIIQEYGEQFGIEGTLEILMEMKMEYDDLWERQQRAFNVFMAMGQKFFEPADGA